MSFSNIKLPSNKSFGLLFSLIFTIIALYCLFNELSFYFVFFFISAFFFIIAILKPSYLYFLNKSWMFAGYVLNIILSPIILGFIYFLLITPTGVIRRYVFKSDELTLKKNNVKTYWILSNKDVANAESFKKQY